MSIEHSSPREIAERIRGIVGGQDRTTIAAMARRLGVNEGALRASMDASKPHPSLDVIVAIVREYGVDPAWLVTGDYDASAHRASLENEATVSREDIARLIIGRIPAAREATQPPNTTDLRLEA